MVRGIIKEASEHPPKGVGVKKLLQAVVSDYVRFTRFLGEVFDSAEADALCDELRVITGLKVDSLPLIRRSLEDALRSGQVLTKDVLKHLIMKLRQNKGYLEAGATIPRWTGTPPVWSVVKIEDLKVIRLRDLPFAKLEVHALTGVLAGETHWLVLPIKYVRWLAKEIGYPRYEKAHERELVGMVTWARLEMTRFGRTTIAKVSPTSGQSNHNRELANARLNKNCSNRQMSCYRCPLGLDSCDLATRRLIEDKDEYEDSTSSGS